MRTLLGLDRPVLWTIERAYAQLRAGGQANTRRTAERVLHRLGLLPPALDARQVRDEEGTAPTPSVLNWQIAEARKRREHVVFAQLARLPSGKRCLHANDGRSARYWVPLSARGIEAALRLLARHLGKSLLIPHGALAASCRELRPPAGMAFALLGYRATRASVRRESRPAPALRGAARALPHLASLEAESIHILREAVAEARRPVMLYSLGKDSSVMLHLARKAFFPAPPPFPLLHVDTLWKFHEMYLFRDEIAARLGMQLIRHVNPEAVARGINPFEHGSAVHTDITKTQGLKQALDAHGFDMVFGGARRDEEASRAKERVFSLRSAAHRWDPKKQRPELWNLYNTRLREGETLRVFPLSNWTEADVWHYVGRERIPVVPLYFARERPVVRRDGRLIIVDDERMPIRAGERIERRSVRMRSLGCYPLSAAIESTAADVGEIVAELRAARFSERQGRLIDADAPASMERKKQEGYF